MSTLHTIAYVEETNMDTECIAILQLLWGPGVWAMLISVLGERSLENDDDVYSRQYR